MTKRDIPDKSEGEYDEDQLEDIQRVMEMQEIMERMADLEKKGSRTSSEKRGRTVATNTTK